MYGFFKDFVIADADSRLDGLKTHGVGKAEQEFVNKILVVHHPGNGILDIGTGFLKFLKHGIFKGYFSHNAGLPKTE
jgi:hypothetical protein